MLIASVRRTRGLFGTAGNVMFTKGFARAGDSSGVMVDDFFDKTVRLRAQTEANTGGRPGLDELADGQAIDLVEVTGSIKWFDVARGYGFIVPDDGSADILLHISALKRDGFLTAIEGARVMVEAVATAPRLPGIPRDFHG